MCDYGPLKVDPHVERRANECINTGNFTIAGCTCEAFADQADAGVELTLNRDNFSLMALPIREDSMDAPLLLADLNRQAEIELDCVDSRRFTITGLLDEPVGTGRHRSLAMTAASNTDRDVIALVFRHFVRAFQPEQDIVELLESPRSRTGEDASVIVAAQTTEAEAEELYAVDGIEEGHVLQVDGQAVSPMHSPSGTAGNARQDRATASANPVQDLLGAAARRQARSEAQDAGVAELHMETWVLVHRASAVSVGGISAVPQPQRYFCELQPKQLRTFVDSSKSLCVNTWKLGPNTTVNQHVDFDGGQASLLKTFTLQRGAEGRSTTFEFETSKECYRWSLAIQRCVHGICTNEIGNLTQCIASPTTLKDELQLLQQASTIGHTGKNRRNNSHREPRLSATSRGSPSQTTAASSGSGAPARDGTHGEPDSAEQSALLRGEAIIAALQGKLASAARSIAFLSRKLQREEEEVLDAQVQLQKMERKLVAVKTVAEASSSAIAADRGCELNSADGAGNALPCDNAKSVESVTVKPTSAGELDAPPNSVRSVNTNTSNQPTDEEPLLANADISPRSLNSHINNAVAARTRELEGEKRRLRKMLDNVKSSAAEETKFRQEISRRLAEARREKEVMDEDYMQMKSQWKTVVQTIRDQKEKIAALEKKLSLLSKSEALLAERHNLRKKNKSLGRDLKKLIHAMGQSVPKAEATALAAENAELSTSLSTHEQLLAVAQMECLRLKALVDEQSKEASSSRQRNVKNLKGNLETLHQQNRELQSLCNDVFGRLNDAQIATNEQKALNKQLGLQVMQLTNQLNALQGVENIQEAYSAVRVPAHEPALPSSSGASSASKVARSAAFDIDDEGQVAAALKGRTSRAVSNASDSGRMVAVEGFICPECKTGLGSLEELVQHHC
eukprot:INCI13419.10.p1 GENE.INCI13419.10~~INCI13419.10.p1  ORF type:complete len:1017 (-),score=223.58 INCI13419.10:1449-4175(-)